MVASFRALGWGSVRPAQLPHQPRRIRDSGPLLGHHQPAQHPQLLQVTPLGGQLGHLHTDVMMVGELAHERRVEAAGAPAGRRRLPPGPAQQGQAGQKYQDDAEGGRRPTTEANEAVVAQQPPSSQKLTV
jgi:hypothetical protein